VSVAHPGIVDELAETELRHFVEDKPIVLGEDLEPRAHMISSAGIDACIAPVLHIASH